MKPEVIAIAVIFVAHSDLMWDRALYNIPWLSPVMRVVERVISTPARIWSRPVPSISFYGR